MVEVEANVEVVYGLSPPERSMSSTTGLGNCEGLRALNSQVRGVWLEKDGREGFRAWCVGTEDCISHTAHTRTGRCRGKGRDRAAVCCVLCRVIVRGRLGCGAHAGVADNDTVRRNGGIVNPGAWC
jgi:hypothetical protein